MALTVTLNGTGFSIPEPGEVGYDQGLTNYLKALATAFPQLGNASTQALSTELDLGTSFGVKALYLKTQTATPSSVGVIRLAKTDALSWRNNAGNADLQLKLDGSDNLLFGATNLTAGGATNPFVAASTSAAQSIPNGTATPTIVVFGTVELDTDAGYNAGTGRYTVPASRGGHYLCTGQLFYANTGFQATLHIFKNAVSTKVYTTTTDNWKAPSISAILNLAAGDIIDFRTTQQQGGSQALNASALSNFMAIKRIAA